MSTYLINLLFQFMQIVCTKRGGILCLELQSVTLSIHGLDGGIARIFVSPSCLYCRYCINIARLPMTEVKTPKTIARNSPEGMPMPGSFTNLEE